MKKKVLVTGASGEIGTIIREDLASTYDLTPVARRPLPETTSIRLDLTTDYKELCDAVAGQDAVVHLAYVEEDPHTTANLTMIKNVYQAVLETPPRLDWSLQALFMRSVDISDYWNQEPYNLIAQHMHDKLKDKDWEKIGENHRLYPNGIYGALKCYIEILGEFYSRQGLQVVILRFGGVRRDDKIVDEPGYRSFWLSRRDCAQIIRRAIDAELCKDFVRVFAVSDNRYRIHDLKEAVEFLGYNLKMVLAELVGNT